MIDLPEPVSPVTAVKPGPERPGEFLDQGEIANAEGGEHCGHGGIMQSCRFSTHAAAHLLRWTDAARAREATHGCLTITFLGTGTSQGVPMIGCDCRFAVRTDPRDKRTRSSIYVETPECAWVVDTGPDFRTQCAARKCAARRCGGLTHSHTDHIMGFDDLRPFCFGRAGIAGLCLGGDDARP